LSSFIPSKVVHLLSDLSCSILVPPLRIINSLEPSENDPDPKAAEN
jgi:hypothetical protein